MRQALHIADAIRVVEVALSIGVDPDREAQVRAELAALKEARLCPTTRAALHLPPDDERRRAWMGR